MKRILTGHTGDVNAVATTTDNQFIISGGMDKTVRIWDIASGDCVKILDGHEGEIRTIAVTRDNKFCLSAGQDSVIRKWGIDTGECTGIFEGHHDSINDLAVNRDSKLLVSGSSDCSLRLWDIASGKCIRIFPEHPACKDMDGLNRLIRSSNEEFAYHDFLVNLAHSVTYNKEDSCFFGHADHILSVAITPTGKYIISGSSDNTMRLWDLNTGRCQWIFGGHNGGIGSWVNDIAVTPSGKYAVSGSYDIMLWKITSKNLRRHLWGIIGEKYIRKIAGNSGFNAMALTPNGRKLIVASGRPYELKVYKLWNKKLIKTFSGHKKQIKAVAVTSDGKYAVSAGSDATIRLWELK